MNRLRYPMKVTRDEEAPEFWNARIYGLGGSKPPDDFIITCGNSPEEACSRAPECLTGYLLSRLGDGFAPEQPPTALPKGKGWEWVSPFSKVEVALQIRELREQARLSQAEAARMMGVAQTTYTRWEQPDKCNATLSSLERIAKVLGKKLEVTFK